MRTKYFVFVFAMFALLLAAPISAHADRLDMGTFTCSAMLAEHTDEIVTIVFWIDGLLSAASGDLVIDANALGSLAERLIEYCAEHQNMTVIDALSAVR